ncbi:MAG: DUF4426 domain-containing protein [Thiopseudomonas sp.]|nr:DUF4426 domain-containing protein [Gammaproteobacteria bacterium]
MRKLVTLACALLLSLSAAAEQKITSGALDIHYIVFNSSFLQPAIAKASGLERGKDIAVLNVSPLRDGKGEKSTVSGAVTNLLGQTRTLNFREIDEGEAVYYIAQFPIDGREILKIAVDLVDSEGKNHSLKFNQEVFPDL